MRLAAVAAAALAAAVVTVGAASASASLTGEQAVKKAQACLLAHGAKATAAGVIGNGTVSFGAGQNATWAFTLTKAWPIQNGTATGVKSITYDRRMVKAKRLVVSRCVMSAIR